MFTYLSQMIYMEGYLASLLQSITSVHYLHPATSAAASYSVRLMTVILYDEKESRFPIITEGMPRAVCALFIVPAAKSYSVRIAPARMHST